ncbi:two-component regulator propeller domain-containing protein [Desulfobacterales bacterium HSG16]|nr:two-component regulator propeller domain-containing protein [Desulfobacterales bacterium HSG16]
MRIYLLAIAFFFILSGMVSAQNNTIRFEHISVAQGLSQSSVHCIIQDNKGFIWLGTQDGLNRYDGYSFKVIKNDPENSFSLSHNIVKSIYEDSKGVLWIGTWGGGLNKFDRKKEKIIRYMHNPNELSSLSHNNVMSIYEDSRNILWIGTENGGINKFDSENEEFTHYQNDSDDLSSLSHNDVKSIYEDSKGNLWVGTEDGLNKFNREKEKFIRYRNNPDDPFSLSQNEIWYIYEDSEATLWIGTKNGGLNKFDQENEKFTHYQNESGNPDSLSHDWVRSIYEDSEGILWIGTEGGGLNRFDRENEKFIRYQNDPNNPFSLSNDVVWSIYEDRSNVLWIGTYTGGLNKYDRGKEQFVHYKNEPENPNSLIHNVVWSIYEDRDKMLWIGTVNGLNGFDRENEKFIRYQNEPDNPLSLSHNEVWSIYEDQAENFWIGTFQGLNKLDRKTGEFTRYINQGEDVANKIKTICEDSKGMLWIGTGGGLFNFDRDKKLFIPYRINTNDPNGRIEAKNTDVNKVWSIYEDSSETLWVGTEEGLCRLDRKNDSFIRYQNDPQGSQSLSDSWILSIYESKAKDLWIGTVGGFNNFHPEEKSFTRYREKDGLPNDVIYGILEDKKNNLWMSTNNGLSRFNPQTKIFKNYSIKDGLQNNEFNAGAFFMNEKGEMFFGGIDGFNAFFPAKKDNLTIPSIAITNFQIFHEPVKVDANSPLKQAVEYTDTIELSHKERVFSFEFAALHFISPEKNQYAYMMDGFDQDWIYSGSRRFATYTNLSAGRYVFRVKGSNNDGLWNEAGASIKIIITPPPWKTWWAYSFYGLFAAGLLFGYIRYKTKAQAEELAHQRRELDQKRRMAELLEKKVEERTCDVNLALEKVNDANDKVMDSLRYAKMIQTSLLPNSDQIKSWFPKSFVIWMPRDVVSGDIFFMDSFIDSDGTHGLIAAVVDCTGHGVPGAFMTMIASSGLRRIIKNEGCYNPARILKLLNFAVKTALQQDTQYAVSDDGLDAAVCSIRFSGADSSILTFSGARIPLIYTVDGKATVIKGNRHSIGYKRSDLNFDFTNHKMNIAKEMSFYMATDGYQDQLGIDEKRGFKYRRFGTKRLRELLKKNSEYPFEYQKEELIRIFKLYQAENERQDDVTILGFGFR